MADMRACDVARQVAPTVTEARAEEAMHRSIRWLDRSIAVSTT